MRIVFFAILFLLLDVFVASGQFKKNGREFYFAIGPSYTKGTFTLNSNHNAHVEFTYTATGVTKSYTLTAGVTAQIFPTSAEMMSISGLTLETVNNKSLVITSDSDIHVSFADRIDVVEDAVMILPADGQQRGTQFYIVTPRYIIGSHTPDAATIVAHCDVLLEITPVVNTYSHPAGTPFTVNLKKGESYAIGTDIKLTANYDISGTFVKVVNSSCCYPISVFSYNITYVNYPDHWLVCCADMSYDQIPPVEWWGTDYYVVPFRFYDKSLLRIVSNSDDNAILFNGSLVKNLNKGEIFDTLIYQPTHLSSKAPAGVCQFMLSEAGGPVPRTSMGDPDMLWIYEPGQGLKNTWFSTIKPGKGKDKYTLTIVSKKSNVSSILLNGSSLSSYFSDFPLAKDHQYAYVPLDSDVNYHLTSAEKIFAFHSAQYTQGSYTLALADLYKDTINISGRKKDTIHTEIAICDFDPFKLVANAAQKYLWASGDTSRSVVVKDTGRYAVMELFSFCTNDTTVHLFHVSRIDSVRLNLRDTAICAGSSVTIATGYDSTLWSTGARASSIVTSVPGTYIAMVTDACNITRRDTIVLSYVVYPPENLLGNDTFICTGTPVKIKVNSMFHNAKWSTGETEDSILAANPGTYIVTVTDPCFEKNSDTIVISAPPKISFDLGRDTELCVMYPMMLSTGYSNTVWQDGSAGAHFMANEAGVYFATVKDVCNRPFSDTVTITLRKFEIDFSLEDSINACPGNEVLLTTGIPATHWSNGATGSSISVKEPGIYIAAVTDSCNVRHADTVVVSFNECIVDYCEIYFPNAFSPNDDQLNDFFRPVSSDVFDKYYLYIFNRYGQEVFSTSDITKGWDGLFGGEPAEIGTYFYMCRFHCGTNGTDHLYKGDVTLIR